MNAVHKITVYGTIKCYGIVQGNSTVTDVTFREFGGPIHWCSYQTGTF